MRQRVYESAERLRAKYVKDPVGELLDLVRQELDSASTDHERAAIVQAAQQAAASLPDGVDDLGRPVSHSENAHKAIYKLAHPGEYTVDEGGAVPYRTQVYEPGTFTKTDQFVSADEWAADHPDFAQAYAALRGAKTGAEALENLAAVIAARADPQDGGSGWEMHELMLFEGFKEFELVDDGTIPTWEQAEAAERQRIHDEAVAEQEQSPAGRRQKAAEIWERLYAAEVERQEAAQAGAEAHEVPQVVPV